MSSKPTGGGRGCGGGVSVGGEDARVERRKDARRLLSRETIGRLGAVVMVFSGALINSQQPLLSPATSNRRAAARTLIRRSKGGPLR